MTIIGLVDSTTGASYPYTPGSSIESGTIGYYPDAIAPEGWLRCDGAEVSQATYSDLYAVVGDKYANSGNVYNNAKPWKQQYDFNLENNGDITGWTIGTSLPEASSSSQAIVTNSRVYLLGGFSVGSTVYTAPINSDGAIETWTTSTSLPGELSSSQAIVTNSRVYLLGGQVGGTLGGDVVSTVYTAPINSDGTLGTWTTGTSLPGALSYSQAIVTNSRVYLLGGFTGSSVVSTVYTAPINSDGAIETWTTSTSLPGELSSSQAIVTNSRVYLLGAQGVSTVYTAPINSDGTLGAWTTGPSLPGGLSNSQAIVTNSRVYLLGGFNDSTVYTAPINSDGTLGTWTTGTSLPGEDMEVSQAIVTNSRVYLLGGDPGSSEVPSVYEAQFSGGKNDYLDSTFIDLAPEAGNFILPNLADEEHGDYTTARRYVHPIIKA